MSDVSVTSLLNLFVFLSLPFVFAYLARLLKIPSLIGYIVGGLILGTLIPTSSKEIINGIAFFGIIFLLFTIGIEINFKHLIRFKKFIIIGGLSQIIVTSLLSYFLSLIFQFPLLTSLLIAFAITSSSTILVAKIIQDRGEEATFVGEIALGILMLQDIAFIPLLIIFESFHHKTIAMSDLVFDISFSMVKAGVIIALMFFIGQRFIPKLFNHIAKQSRELLNLFIILFIVAITFLSLLLQIPVLIGVFVAGILVGQTSEHYHIFSQVRPLRDLLAVVFFVFIGVNVNVATILPLLPKIILFSLCIMLIKFLVIFITCIKLRLHSKSAFSIAVLLFQISENAFILMYSAFSNNIITNQEYYFIITSVLFTLLLSPIAINNKEAIYKLLKKLITKHIPLLENYINKRLDRDISPIDDLDIKNHIVICGYGRVGHQIGRALMMANIPFIAIDFNFYVVEKAKEEGVNIIYGDPSDLDILDYAQVDEAVMLVSAVSDSFSQEAIILNAQKLNPKIVIISRAHTKHDSQRMMDLGVDVVVEPEFEASLAIIKKLLYSSKSSKDEVSGHIKRIKIEQGMI